MASFSFEDLGGGIRRLTLASPGKRNAIDDSALRALDQALSQRSGVRVWWVRGEGDVFCAGYDLGALGAAPPGGLPDALLGDVLDRLQAHPAPSVAQVVGPAYGAGCELACACDLRVADPSAVFCLPPAKLGIVYAWRGMRRVQQRVGPQRAREMFLTARRVDAETAKAWGLVDRLGPDAGVVAHALCDELSGLSPSALAGMKATLAAVAPPAPDAALRAELEALQRQSFASAEALEGRTAFIEKRVPVFEDP